MTPPRNWGKPDSTDAHVTTSEERNPDGSRRLAVGLVLVCALIPRRGTSLPLRGYVQAGTSSPARRTAQEDTMTKKHSLYIRFDVDLDMSAPSQREMERIANLAISMLDKVPQNIRAGRVAGVLYGPDGNHILGEFALTPRFEAPK